MARYHRSKPTNTCYTLSTLLFCALLIVVLGLVILSGAWALLLASAFPLANFIPYLLALPLAIIFFWVVPKLATKYWYVDYDEEGFTKTSWGIKRFIPWDDVVEITTMRHPHFTRYYDDTLLIQTETKTYRVQLPPYGLSENDEITSFVNRVRQAAGKPAPLKEVPEKLVPEEVEDRPEPLVRVPDKLYDEKRPLYEKPIKPPMPTGVKLVIAFVVCLVVGIILGFGLTILTISPAQQAAYLPMIMGISILAVFICVCVCWAMVAGDCYGADCSGCSCIL